MSKHRLYNVHVLHLIWADLRSFRLLCSVQLYYFILFCSFPFQTKGEYKGIERNKIPR